MNARSEQSQENRYAYEVGLWENEGGASRRPIPAEMNASGGRKVPGRKSMIRPTTESRFPTDVQTAITAYLGLMGGHRPISIINSIQSLRKQFPELAETDHDLTNVIASNAIAMSLNIDFDGGESNTYVVPQKVGWNPTRQ